MSPVSLTITAHGPARVASTTVERGQRPAPSEHRHAGVGRLSRQPPRRRVGHHLGDGGERERERSAAYLAYQQTAVEGRPLRLLLVARHALLDVAGPRGDQAPESGLAGCAAVLPTASTAPGRPAAADALPGLVHPCGDIPASGEFRARPGRSAGWARRRSCDNGVP
jgi:hypothetical protein